MQAAADFFKRESVFCIAWILAIVSMFIVPPSPDYVAYIDFRTLALLFCLMITVAGFTKLGVFEKLLAASMKVVSSTRGLLLLLVLLCFFSSMWITNDVALITFVPFTVMALNRLSKNRLLIYAVVLQTIAANLGSMCTPLGNPQNLYLYSVSGISLLEFLTIMLPYTLAALAILLVLCLLPKSENVVMGPEPVKKRKTEEKYIRKTKVGYAVYLSLFLVCLLCVLHILDDRIMLIAVALVILFFDVRMFLKVDYMLLLTFAAFFIFVGNIRQVNVIHSFLVDGIQGAEVLFSVATSQVISNVPAAVLLSGFTEDYKSLLIGTNLGGLGTLIASMASLISYKFYQMTRECNTKKYILVFTGWNLFFLALLLLLWLVIK